MMAIIFSGKNVTECGIFVWNDLDACPDGLPAERWTARDQDKKHQQYWPCTTHPEVYVCSCSCTALRDLGVYWCHSTLRHRSPNTFMFRMTVILRTLSRLDQNNSLLSGVPKYLLYRLQKIQDAAAKVILGGQGKTMWLTSSRNYTGFLYPSATSSKPSSSCTKP